MELIFALVINILKTSFKILKWLKSVYENKSELKIEIIEDKDNFYLKISNYGFKEITNLKIKEIRKLEDLKYEDNNFEELYKLKELYNNENISYVMSSIIVKLVSFKSEIKNYKIEKTNMLLLYCNFYTESLSEVIDIIENDLNDIIHYTRMNQAIYLMKNSGIINKKPHNTKEANLLISFNKIRDTLKIFLDIYNHLYDNSLKLGLTINNPFFLEEDKNFNRLIFHIITIKCETKEDIPIDLCMKLIKYINKISQNCIVIPRNFIKLEEKMLKGHDKIKIYFDNRLLINLSQNKFFMEKNKSFLQLKSYKLKILNSLFMTEHEEISICTHLLKYQNKNYLLNNVEYERISWLKVKIRQQVVIENTIIDKYKEHDQHYK